MTRRGPRPTTRAPTAAPSTGWAASRTVWRAAPQACEAYAASPPVVLELPFNSLDEARTQGDMPLETLVNSVPADLDRFWGELLERSGTIFGGLSETVRSYPTGGPYPRCRGLTTSDFEQGVVYCPSPEFVAYEQGGANAAAPHDHRRLLGRRAVRRPLGRGRPASSRARAPRAVRPRSSGTA